MGSANAYLSPGVLRSDGELALGRHLVPPASVACVLARSMPAEQQRVPAVSRRFSWRSGRTNRVCSDPQHDRPALNLKGED